MLSIDLIGIIITGTFIGLRYPHIVLAAVFVHEMGKIITALFLQQHIENIIIAGVFGKTVVSQIGAGVKDTLVAFSGPLTNYIVSTIAGGFEYERTAHLLNPFAKLKYPFAVVNMRLAVASLIFNIFQRV